MEQLQKIKNKLLEFYHSFKFFWVTSVLVLLTMLYTLVHFLQTKSAYTSLIQNFFLEAPQYSSSYTIINTLFIWEVVLFILSTIFIGLSIFRLIQIKRKRSVFIFLAGVFVLLNAIHLFNTYPVASKVNLHHQLVACSTSTNDQAAQPLSKQCQELTKKHSLSDIQKDMSKAASSKFMIIYGHTPLILLIGSMTSILGYAAGFDSHVVYVRKKVVTHEQS